jgi:hypothetical protein
VVSVFDELDKLDDSRIPTWQAVVDGATADDIGDLGDLAGAQGLGADNWSGMNVLCSDCSHGDPVGTHQHRPVDDDQTLIGLAGSESELRACLTDWQRTRPGLRLIDLQLIWA